jgi:hypothetical protein
LFAVKRVIAKRRGQAVPRTLATSLLLALIVGGPASAAQLRLRWLSSGTDQNPGAWTIRLTDAEPGARGTYVVDDGPRVQFGPGETQVAIPATLGTHRITVTGPDDLAVSDTRTIVQAVGSAPSVSLEYAGKGTLIQPGVWMINLHDPDRPDAAGTYRIDGGPVVPLKSGSSVVGVPYFAVTYTITVTARTGPQGAPVTLTDTRTVR